MEKEKQRLSEIADDAIKNGFISLPELCMILAIYKDYVEHLPLLWNKYQLNIRDTDSPDVSSPEKRRGVWYKILWRLTHGTVAELPHGLKRIKLLPMEDDGYFNLEKLREYFTDYLEIPLPEMLFPSVSQDDQTVDQTGQKNKRQAVAITEAKQLQKEYPSADRRRIQRMVDQSMREHNLKPYSQSNFNRLIKDLKIANASSGNPHKKKLKSEHPVFGLSQTEDVLFPSFWTKGSRFTVN